MAAAAKTSLPSGYDHEAGRSTKTVTFYVNGDQNFQGHVMVITPRRFRNVEGLLDELHRLTYSRHVKDLPLGVRYLFSLESGDRIDNLDQLIDGKAYVCSSHSRLKKISYGGKAPFANWGTGQRIELPSLHLMAYNETKRRPLGVKTTEHSRQRGYSDPKSILGDGRTNYVKPKIVTVVRNGPHKPRTAVKTLLNKRTAQKLEQVLDEVSNSFGNTSGLSAPRKLYNVSGQVISDVMELFRDENNIFIAVGSEKFSPDDIADILEDFEHGSSSKKRSKHKESKASNEGMLHSKQKKNKEHDQTKTINTEEERKLPKLPDIHAKVENKPKQESNNKPHLAANSNAKRSHVNHKPAKHVSSRSPGKKQNQNAVKLPQIGSNNLVSQPEKETKENEVISKPSNKENGDVAGVQNANNELGETGHVNINFPSADKPSRKESVGKKHSVVSKVNTKKTSRDDSCIISEVEVKYGTVTDKTVEDVYLIGKKLGDGNFADVRECTDRITKKEFALKIVDKSKIQGKEQMIRDEIDIMRRCKHPNIVRMYEDYDTTRHIYLVMELIQGGDLFDAISSSVKFTEAVTRNYVKDIAKSLDYLHKRKIVHRDLKPENLLVHKKPNGQTILKLADFGLAMEVKSPIFTVCGTPTYVAPEILEETGYGLKVDMWAAGVITYIMLCGFPPFRSAKRDQDELFDLIMDGDYEFLSPYWDNISNEAKDLISKLLVVSPSKRYTAENVLGHPWVKHTGVSRELGSQFLTSRRKFKAAALAVQGAKRFESLAEQFHRQRGEKVFVR